MIPKILHFIWFGQRPDYVDFCIRSFGERFPDFKINTIFMETMQEIVENEITRMLLDQIKDESGTYLPSIRMYKELGRDDLQILSNILRLHLLNTYGGIYVDCDCFPSGDLNELTEYESFIVYRRYSDNFCGPDCFFMGKSKESVFVDEYRKDIGQKRLVYDPDKLRIIYNRRMFMECRLTDDMVDHSFPIEHYNIQAWKHN